MGLIDSRRMTGPNLLADGPGAVIDGRVVGVDPATFIGTWEVRARQILDAVGWADESLATRSWADGVSVFHSAPVDALYAATEVNEWAWAAAEGDLLETATWHEPLQEAATRLQRLIAEERNPALMTLRATARESGVSFLSDDDHVSVGTGAGSRCWPVAELPSVADVPWPEIHDIPRVLVTGTNGKTTTVRMLASIVDAAGRIAGFTCTDGIYVEGASVDSGDWSGPGGARAVLRDRRVEVAILETARGGMLRRGLAIDRADGVLVTNVAADHLGEWGVLTVEDVARAKLVVAEAVRHGAPLVVNADDPCLSRVARDLDRPVTWIAVAASEEVRAHAGPTDVVWTLDEGWLARTHDGSTTRVVRAEAMPATLGGLAAYNVSNALGAAALAHALELPDEAIRTGLLGFESSPELSPGRGNLFDLGGVRVLVDFVHNPHGLAAIADMLRAMAPQRTGLMIGHAGDRDDESIRELAQAAWGLEPERIAIKEMADYLRGRAVGAVPAIIQDEFASLGAPASTVSMHDGEVAAARALLAWARPGDFLLLASQADRAGVLGLVEACGAASWAPGDDLPLPERQATWKRNR
jgi:UDP-N-acetylmuramyl tripeptide synthase